MGSPEGDRLRELARKQDQLADDVSAAGKRLSSLSETPTGVLKGFSFEGPLAFEVRSSNRQSSEYVRTAGRQLRDAANAIREKADETRSRATAADLRYLAQQALEKLTGGD
jgi:hypothetical protein